MTGWRLGFAILPPALVDPFSKLIINSVSCTSSFEQMAAVEALNGPQDAVEAMVEEFRRAAAADRRWPERTSQASAAGCRTARSTSSRTSPARA